MSSSSNDKFLARLIETKLGDDVKVKNIFKSNDIFDRDRTKYSIYFEYKDFPLYLKCFRLTGSKPNHKDVVSEVNKHIKSFTSLCDGTNWLDSPYQFIMQSILIKEEMIKGIDENKITVLINLHRPTPKRIANIIDDIKQDSDFKCSFEDIYSGCFNHFTEYFEKA